MYNKVVFRKKLGRAYLIFVNMLAAFARPFRKRLLSNNIENARSALRAYSPCPDGTCSASNQLLAPECDLQIVVPAYNVEKYLKPCMDSILSQKTKYSFRIVLVDDGSTDNTPALADLYADHDLVKVIHQENRGFSGARNRALETLFARYIMFVDSDDILPDGAIETLMDAALVNDADIVQGDFLCLCKDGQVLHAVQNGEVRRVVPALGNLNGFAWGKVFRSQLWADMKFPDGFWFEDTCLSYLMFPRVERAFVSPRSVYIYRQNNSQSITKTYSTKPKAVDTHYITELMMNIHSEWNLPNDKAYLEKVFRQIVLNYARTAKVPEEIQEAIFTCIAATVEQTIPGTIDTSKSLYSSLIRALRTRDYGTYSLYMKLATRL